MQGIILAAGKGTRLQSMSGGLPKCLVEVLDEPLLITQLRLLAKAFPAMSNVVVVVGHRQEDVRRVGGSDLSYVENPLYEVTNTAASLHLALQHNAEESLIVNGDVYFDASALSGMPGQVNGALCEFKASLSPEEVQVLVDDEDHIIRIGKDIGGMAEAVGIYFTSEEWNDLYLANYSNEDGSRYYEDVFDRLLHAGASFTAVALGNGTAIEIDTPADLTRARSRARAVL